MLDLVLRQLRFDAARTNFTVLTIGAVTAQNLILEIVRVMYAVLARHGAREVRA